MFVIADLHFGQARVAARRGFDSLDAMEGLIIANWNAVVGANDLVWVLGDVGRGPSLAKLSLIAGEKRLVAGNADDIDALVSRRAFSRIYASKKVGRRLLTHLPVHPSLLAGGLINIHGHLHDRRLGSNRHVCVSVEQVNYAPLRIG